MQANINMQDKMRIVALHELGYNISQICDQTGFSVSIFYTYYGKGLNMLIMIKL